MVFPQIVYKLRLKFICNFQMVKKVFNKLFADDLLPSDSLTSKFVYIF